MLFFRNGAVMLRLMKAVYLCLCMLAAFCFPAAALPADCSQVIVGSADGWNSSHVQLSLLEKGPRGWVMVKGPFPARLGKSGLVWGRGVSQGHSDAVRRVAGVKDAKQYTIPVEAALEAVRNGENPELGTRQKHTRECFVVLEEGADAAKVEKEIREMPNYFSDYDTTVHFISGEELKRDHSGIPHGGFVLRSGRTGMNCENSHLIEYSLKLDSNPEFTASVLLAYARAAYRLSQEGQSGCKTVFDIAPAYLSAKSGEELRKIML